MPGDQLPTAPVRLSPIAETRRREGMPEETALAWLVRRSVAQRLPRVSSSARPLYPILVVDGDKAVLNKSAILTNANFRVLSAVSGADALDLAEETDRKIDLLLSDVPMWTCPGTRHHLVAAPGVLVGEPPPVGHKGSPAPKGFRSQPVGRPGYWILTSSWRTTFSSELRTFMSPSYSMNPSRRNLFMKKLILERVVPTISARVS